jgi:hypothetical protein
VTANSNKVAQCTIALLKVEPLGSRIVGGKIKKPQAFSGLLPTEINTKWFKN